ncbi:hypothetical protein [Burkholderia ubonensis]|uniref:hypothetical protein n=1 Tax=Burkholderia ubonensis TaxID=101571 RepID=UPI000ADB581F|nr:hypothetical protein [Burkholderia ubonensis]
MSQVGHLSTIKSIGRPSGSNVGLAAHFTPHFDGCAMFGADFGGLAVAGNATNSGA